MGQPRYKVVMNTLLRDIFKSRLKPGDRLPTEREYSKMMNVDRTSLRIALKQLETMDVLEIRQGDGIYVKNYLKNAGVDFLKMLFLQQEADANETIIDEYIIDEIMDFWIDYLPMMLNVAMKRFTPRDMREFVGIVDKEYRNLRNRQAVKASELEQLEFVAEKTGNLLYLLISNSTRPLKRTITDLFVNAFSDSRLEEYISAKLAMLKHSVPGDTGHALKASESMKKILTAHSVLMRQTLHHKPGNSRNHRPS